MNRFCCTIPSDCSICYETTIAWCPDSIIFQAGLVPGASLYLWMRDKMDNLFQDLITVNADGSFEINQNNFPKLTPAFGAVEIFLSTDENGADIVSMTFDGDEYNCLIFSVNEPVYLTDDTGCNYLTDENNNFLIAE